MFSALIISPWHSVGVARVKLYSESRRIGLVWQRDEEVFAVVRLFVNM